MTKLTEMTLAELQVAMQYSAASVDVLKTKQGWAVKKDDIRIVSARRTRQTRYWARLDRCVATLEEHGVQRVLVKMDNEYVVE